jgi:hypothetical protein
MQLEKAWKEGGLQPERSRGRRMRGISRSSTLHALFTPPPKDYSILALGRLQPPSSSMLDRKKGVDSDKTQQV